MINTREWWWRLASIRLENAFFRNTKWYHWCDISLIFENYATLLLKHFTSTTYIWSTFSTLIIESRAFDHVDFQELHFARVLNYSHRAFVVFVASVWSNHECRRLLRKLRVEIHLVWRRESNTNATTTLFLLASNQKAQSTRNQSEFVSIRSLT